MAKFDFSNVKKTKLSKGDKSSKGNWDERIKELCGKINSDKDYLTTSSCSGRILLMIETFEKKSGLFLFVSHEKVGFDKIKKEFIKISEKNKEMIYLKQEPCVLAVSCKTLEKAQELVDKARNAGWKRSGITTTSKNNIVELFSTERMDIPIIKNGKILIDDDSLRIIINEANSKLERTWEKIEKLKKLT